MKGDKKPFDHDGHLVRELKRVGIKAGKPSKDYPKDNGWKSVIPNVKMMSKYGN